VQCYIYIFILLAALLIACVTVSIGTLSHLEQPVVALLWLCQYGHSTCCLQQRSTACSDL